MSTVLRLSPVASTMVDVIQTGTLPARLPVRAEGDDEEIATSNVDAALTLRLVEHAASSMYQMERQLETIALRGRDLLRLTRDERQRFQAELQAVRVEAETWKQHALAAEDGLRDATLRAWEADLQRREGEFALQTARERAEAAERRARDVEFYLRKIDAALRSRFSMIARPGRPPGGDRAIP